MSASTMPSAVTTRPPRTARSDKLDREVLRAFPQRLTTDLGEVLGPLCHGREVISRELADLAAEVRRAVREQNLHLADAPRIDQHLAGRGIAGVILVIDPQ